MTSTSPYEMFFRVTVLLSREPKLPSPSTSVGILPTEQDGDDPATITQFMVTAMQDCIVGAPNFLLSLRVMEGALMVLAMMRILARGGIVGG